MTNTLTPHGMHCMEISGGNRAEDSTNRTPGLDIRVISRPLDGAGGDVHYVSLCSHGLITRVLLADVCGHGVPVAELAGDLRKLIRTYINTTSQTRLVSRLNDQWAARSLYGLFATSIVATYLAKTRRLTLSNAGHPRPLLFRSRTRTWRLLDGKPAGTGNLSDLPLGIHKGTVYTQNSIDLGVGDRVVLYTDLLIETLDRGGAPLGEEGLLKAVRRIPWNSQAVSPILLEEILSNTSPDSPKDDVTILELCHIDTDREPRAAAALLNSAATTL